ncbi:hypothetical protein V9T40_001855 [Parthenolecanium corni]|uniref:Glycerate kinase n=1 Tax=Parthenolecanium corni TaxID=536013 RepID=A0AAN9TF86_9HEMI
MNNELRSLFAKAIESVRPGSLIRSTMRRHSHYLIVRDRFFALNHNCYLIGFGKAVLAMADQVVRVVGEHLREGILSVPRGSAKATLGPTISIVEGADNNLPDADSFEAACRIVQLAKRCSRDDLLLVLISGGGSALLPYPVPPVSLAEKMAVIKAVAGAGADIRELNTVRKALSEAKGGKLALLAHPAHVVSFILSDVVGDPLDTIASGPTVLPYVSARPEALSVLKKYQLLETVPHNVKLVLLREDSCVAMAKTVRPGVHNLIIGNNSTCLTAMKELADQSNMQSVVLTNRVVGFVTQVADVYSELIECVCFYLHEGDRNNLLRTLQQLKINHLNVPYVDDTVEKLCEYFEYPSNTDSECKTLFLISGGEPTVRIMGRGKGGRNQELSLRMAVALHRLKERHQWMNKFEVHFMSGGTDGIDGPTDAAGAIVNSNTIDQAVSENLNVETVLKNNDSYTFFSEFDGGSHLIKTGHTGTNVMDVQVIVISLK